MASGRHLTLQAALRLDYPDGADEQLNPRLGIVYKLKDGNTRIHANWGRGFKLPSLYALGHPIVGNPALRPERSQSTDLSISRTHPRKQLELSLGLFHNGFRNQIDLQEVPTLLLVNRNEVVTRGAQFRFTFSASRRLQLNGHVDYLETDIRDSTEQLRNRPTWRAGAGLV